jgi:hypothetical protein
MHIGNKTTYALFFTAPLKRVVGVRGFWGGGLARNTASILSKWLWYWLFNIMLLYDFLCGWMLA